VRVSPVLAGLSTYPFVRLEQAKRSLAARGVDVIDFGTGDPREPTDELIRRALAESIPETSSYPLAEGLPELRAAVAAWCRRRFAVELDPERQVIPTLGSKEAIFGLAQVLVDRSARRDLVAYTEPGYPVYERGALFAGAETLALPLREAHGWLPDLEAVDAETWRRLAVLWINYPNNPTGALAPLELFRDLAARAREHDFLLASDEAYSELWFEAPPPSTLQVGDLRNVAVFNTLSKRSSMTGYRSGFVAGDPELIAALRAYRPTVGTAPQEFVQRASVVAWGDEAHVERVRAVYAAKRAVFTALLERKGLRIAGGPATFYLWVAVPGGEASEDFAARLLEHGVLVAPGAYFGPAGEGYFRLSLVPTLERCREAAQILEEVL
jgi:acetylornithine aminotransferase